MIIFLLALSFQSVTFDNKIEVSWPVTVLYSSDLLIVEKKGVEACRVSPAGVGVVAPGHEAYCWQHAVEAHNLSMDYEPSHRVMDKALRALAIRLHKPHFGCIR